MTLLDLWNAIVAGGTGFVLFLGVALFFTGRLVNGQVARQARLDGEHAMKTAHEAQLALLRQRFDEMQAVWRERFEEATRERNYYRSIALTFARQAEQGIAALEVVTGASGTQQKG